MRVMSKAAVILAVVALGAACSLGPAKPSRETVQALLQTEAEGLKRDGEKVIPGMGVKSIWTVEGIDLQEQPKDDNRPWRGTVRFTIDSAMREPDGSIVKDQIKKKFDYVYDAGMKRWLMQYK